MSEKQVKSEKLLKLLLDLLEKQPTRDSQNILVLWQQITGEHKTGCAFA